MHKKLLRIYTLLGLMLCNLVSDAQAGHFVLALINELVEEKGSRLKCRLIQKTGEGPTCENCGRHLEKGYPYMPHVKVTLRSSVRQGWEMGPDFVKTPLLDNEYDYGPCRPTLHESKVPDAFGTLLTKLKSNSANWEVFVKSLFQLAFELDKEEEHEKEGGLKGGLVNNTLNEESID